MIGASDEALTMPTSSQSYAATRKDIDCCQFQRWYESFRSKTIKSRVVAMPPRFLQYLKEDGLILPEVSDHYFGKDELSDDEELTEVNDGEQLSNSDNDEELVEFMRQIQKLIRELKGEVFVKTNWSAPIDAAWVNAAGMKALTKEDVVVLLKSSDRTIFDMEQMYDRCDQSRRISKDVEHHDSTSDTQQQNSSVDDAAVAQKSPVSPVLVLRKWTNLHKSMEFRVFVRNHEVVGICQRDCSTYYDFLADVIDEYHDLIVSFHDTVIRGSTEMASYAVDVYVDKQRKIWIIDFNPFGEPTCALLFEWSELWTAPASAAASAGDDGRENAALVYSTPPRNTPISNDTDAAPLQLSIVVDLPSSEQQDGSDMTPRKMSPFELADLSHGTDDAEVMLANLKRQQRERYRLHQEMLERERVCEFRFIEDERNVLQTTAGAKRGPVDVHLAPDFHKFMELCKEQEQQLHEDEDDGGDVVKS